MSPRLGLFPIVLVTAACVVLRDEPQYVVPPADTYSAERMPVVLGAGAPEVFDCAEVSSEFFTAARVKPMIGRLFIEAEHHGAATPVAIVSHRGWQERFGGTPDVIGRTVQIAGQRTTIVGVAPRGFDVPPGVVLWVPRQARQARLIREAGTP